MAKFKEGDRVALVEDYIGGLNAGDIGTVWCLYNDNGRPQAYEVMFTSPEDGEDFQSFMYEDDLKAVPSDVGDDLN
jgi:hypothetical protein